MAQFVVEDFHQDVLDKLDNGTRREIRRKVLWAGAKVVEKEMKDYILANHKVRGYMGQSVTQTKVPEDIEGDWVEIDPQGEDPRGVSYEMKNKIIITGYYNKATGYRLKNKDSYISKMRKRIAPRVMSVMQQQFALCMEDLNK